MQTQAPCGTVPQRACFLVLPPGLPQGLRPRRGKGRALCGPEVPGGCAAAKRTFAAPGICTFYADMIVSVGTKSHGCGRDKAHGEGPG